jgi:hypothetical protein
MADDTRTTIQQRTQHAPDAPQTDSCSQVRVIRLPCRFPGQQCTCRWSAATVSPRIQISATISCLLGTWVPLAHVATKPGVLCASGRAPGSVYGQFTAAVNGATGWVAGAAFLVTGRVAPAAFLERRYRSFLAVFDRFLAVIARNYFA